MRTLLTRDGRKIGNAILIREHGSSEQGVPLFEIETDYGNKIPNINKNELEAYFYPGRETTYEEWSRDRTRLIIRAGPEPEPNTPGTG